MMSEYQKILFVGENTLLQEKLQAKASECGIELVSFGSCEDGWGYFEQESPRLVVMGVDSPASPVFDLCKRMKSSAEGKYISVLMVGDNDSIEHLNAIESGANCYTFAPFENNFFGVWLAVALKNLQELAELENSNSQLEDYKKEMEDVNDQLEDSINRANQMAMEAEQAYVEINQIFKTVAGGIVLIDMAGNILRHNENFLEIIDSDSEDVSSCKCEDVLHLSLYESTQSILKRVKDGEERVESLVSLESEDGSKVHYSIISTAFHGLVGELMGIVEHITDITQRVEAEEALKESEKRYRKLSVIDELTGLFNKRHFSKSLKDEIVRVERNGQPLTLIIMDIDNFKIHNDTYGHADGDKVLAKLGEVLKSAVRCTDQPSRYGGEEFTVILPSTEGEGGMVLAERIRKNFADISFFPNADEEVHKTLSLGVSQYIPGDDVESFVKRADANLYEAKHKGKNRSVLG